MQYLVLVVYTLISVYWSLNLVGKINPNMLSLLHGYSVVMSDFYLSDVMYCIYYHSIFLRDFGPPMEDKRFRRNSNSDSDTGV